RLNEGSSFSPIQEEEAIMARSATRLKMGYYPLPPIEAQNIRSLLTFSGPCSVIDPCAGKGTALNPDHGWCASTSIWSRTRDRAWGGSRKDWDSDDPGQ